MFNAPPPLVRVQIGETTSAIADRLGVSNEELTQANPSKSIFWMNGVPVFSELEEGESLVVPHRVARSFLLEQFPASGFAAPDLAPLAGAKAASPCKPGEAELAPGVCVPGAKAPVPGVGCGSGYREVLGQCVPDQGGPTATPPCGPETVEILGRCVPKSTPGQKSKVDCKPGEMQVSPGVCIPSMVPGGGSPTKPNPSGGCPEGMISVFGQCIPDPTKQSSKGSSAPCGPGTTLIYPGLCVPTGAQSGTSGSGCPDGSMQLTPDLCLPPGAVPGNKPGPCGEGRIEVVPGVCIPAPSSGGGGGSSTTPPCPDGWSSLMKGLCAPPGAVPGAPGGDQPPCGPGFQQLAPGLCIPIGTPTGSSAGGCGSGRIEILPGVCIPDPQGGSVPVDKNAPTPQECVEAYGPSSFPYRDPASGMWACGICPENEVPTFGETSALCGCRPGLVRKDINDPSSPCVPPDQATNTTAIIPETQEERDAACQQAFGSNSTAVFVGGEWRCNVCRPDEYVDQDGYCVCLKGTHRAIDGDLNSACVPDDKEEAPAKPSSNTFLIAATIGMGALAVLGIGILSAQNRPEDPETSDER